MHRIGILNGSDAVRAVVVIDDSGALVSIEGEQHFVDLIPEYMERGLALWVAVERSMGGVAPYVGTHLAPLDPENNIKIDCDGFELWPDIAPFNEERDDHYRVSEATPDPPRNITPKRRARPAPRIR